GAALALFAASLLCITARLAAAESQDPIPILAWSNTDAFSSVAVDGGSGKADLDSLVQRSKFSDLGFVFVFRTEKVSMGD
ncbi:hypothetical protein GBAR_LOCUS9587, partial [Geodia barretti]